MTTDLFDDAVPCAVPGNVSVPLYNQDGLYITTGGILKVNMAGNPAQVRTFTLEDGAMFKGRVVSIAEGTTASGIFALVKGV